jgi:centromere protein C
MPSSARKSSISSARRTTQRAHVPYRGDNLEVGKRTGVQIPRIERRSDGFEPFEELLREADKRTPPKVKGIRKSKPAQQQPVFDDADGEMSMDIDDSTLSFNFLPPRVYICGYLP